MINFASSLVTQRGAPDILKLRNPYVPTPQISENLNYFGTLGCHDIDGWFYFFRIAGFWNNMYLNRNYRKRQINIFLLKVGTVNHHAQNYKTETIVVVYLFFCSLCICLVSWWITRTFACLTTFLIPTTYTRKNNAYESRWKNKQTNKFRHALIFFWPPIPFSLYRPKW